MPLSRARVVMFGTLGTAKGRRDSVWRHVLDVIMCSVVTSFSGEDGLHEWLTRSGICSSHNFNGVGNFRL